MNHKDIVSIISNNYTREYNSVSIGFNRFENVWPGFVKGEVIGLTGGADSGKTKLVIQSLKNALQLVKKVNNPDELDIKIFMCLTQHSEKSWRALLISRLLYEDYKIKITSREIFSILGKKGTRTLSANVIQKIESLNKFFDYFEQKVTIIESTVPSVIEGVVTNWINKNYLPYEELGRKKWKLRNVNVFPCFIIDQITDLSNDFDRTNKISLDTRGSMTFLMNHMKDWAKNYDFACLAVHPQISDKEKVEFDFSSKPKAEKVEPSYDGLALNKTIASDYNSIFGLFMPHSYGIKMNRSYDVTRLQFNYVSLKTISSDDVARNVQIGLWFDGAVGFFAELPKAQEFLEPKVSAADKDVPDRAAYREFLNAMKKGEISLEQIGKWQTS